jgi:hypothetical protein
MGWTSNLSTTNVKGLAAFVGMFNFWNVVGHHWHFGMGVEVHPTKCMGMTWERWQPCWCNLNKHSCLCKTFQSCKGRLELDIKNSVSVIEQKKWMQYQNITIQKLFMDGMYAYLNYFFLLTLFTSFN